MSASTSVKNGTDPRLVAQLEEGLELWRVPVDELIEQDKNARALEPAAFERLQRTVERDKRLESLPFCALTDKGVEVVSGHHRTRVARAAKLKDVFALVDTTGLGRSAITAKQLAHNSINGRDDPQVVKELYESIDDADARLEAFIDPSELDLDLEALSVGNVNIDFDHRVISVVFLPHEQDRFARAADAVAEHLPKDVEQVYLAQLEQVGEFQRLAATVSDAVEVKAFGAILGVVADVVLKAFGAEADLDRTERVHLSQVVKRAYIPREAAETIERALDRLEERGEIGDANRWQGLEYLAAEYLAGR